MSMRVGGGLLDTYRPGYGNSIVGVYIAGTETLASLYSDELLTVSAANPQTLVNLDQGDISYGRFTVPLYTASAHYLVIDSAEQTGVIRPALTTLVDQDASEALVTVEGGNVPRALEDHLAVFIHAENYGAISASESAATNNATLVLAIAVAAALGGGEVLVPAGVLLYTNLTLSSGVIITGRGRGITTLRSTYAGKTFTLSGDKAGFRNLTLDGSTLVASSIGVYSKAINETVFDDVEVKRFETGIQQQGGLRANWKDLYLENCTTGAKLHGDNDASNGANGSEWRYNKWDGGRVTNCTTAGVELRVVDKKCWNNDISDVGFESNTGTALNIVGARHTKLPGCWWASNTTDLVVDDGPAAYSSFDTVVGLHLDGGSMTSGIVTLKNTLQDVLFDKMSLSSVAVTLTTPVNNVVVRDCIEDALVTIAGDGTKWTRCRTLLDDFPSSDGLTTDATATKGWSYKLAPGEVIHLEAIVIGNSRNNENRSVFHIARSAHRPGSQLAYDGQTANFTAGAILTGATSGATGRIVLDTDGGATGTLVLRSIDGAFLDNEIITDNVTGSATANGTLVSQNCLFLSALGSLETAYESDAATDVYFTINTTSIEVTVVGKAAFTYSWTIAVKVISGE